VVVGAMLVGLGSTDARAELIVEDWNWADSVVKYSDKIQNYGGILMTAETTWWLTGPPDADSTHDYVAGWKTTDTGQYITMNWQDGIADVAGDDLVVRVYSGPKASAAILASTDGTWFTQIGTIGAGTPLECRLEYFDLGGLFSDQTVSYVQVQRLASGPNTGMFFDAFGGAPVPEPGTITLLTMGAATLFVLRRRHLCSQDT